MKNGGETIKPVTTRKIESDSSRETDSRSAADPRDAAEGPRQLAAAVLITGLV